MAESDEWLHWFLTFYGWCGLSSQTTKISQGYVKPRFDTYIDFYWAKKINFAVFHKPLRCSFMRFYCLHNLLFFVHRLIQAATELIYFCVVRRSIDRITNVCFRKKFDGALASYWSNQWDWGIEAIANFERFDDWAHLLGVTFFSNFVGDQSTDTDAEQSAALS